MSESPADRESPEAEESPFETAPPVDPRSDEAFRDFLVTVSGVPRVRQPKPWRLVFRISTLVWLTIVAAVFFTVGREVGFLLFLAPIALAWFLINFFGPIAAISSHCLFDSRWLRWTGTFVALVPMGGVLIAYMMAWPRLTLGHREMEPIIGSVICWLPQTVAILGGWVGYRVMKARERAELANSNSSEFTAPQDELPEDQDGTPPA